MTETRIEVAGGKYGVILRDDGPSTALRYGEDKGLPTNREHALACEVRDLRLDAARWRAFVNCGFVNLQGWAGCDIQGDRMPLDVRPVGSVHFGAEFWVRYDPEFIPDGDRELWGKILTAFADDCIAAQAETTS